jgi:hypothetical protein
MDIKLIRDNTNIPNIKIVFEKAIKKYKFKKFRKNIYLNKHLINLYNKIDLFNSDLDINLNKNLNKKFQILSYELCNKELIISMENILNLYFNYNPININIKINARDILSAYMIYYCDDILENYNEKEYILEYSKQLIDQIKILTFTNINNSFNIKNFNKILIKYYDTLIIFKEKDKIKQLNYFVKEWKNIEETRILISESDKYSNEQKIQVLNIIEEEKIKLKKYILLLKSNYNFEYLKKIIENTKNIKKKIIDTYKNVFLNELELKNFDIFIKILNEIKAFLIIFNSSKKQEYDEKIDSEFYSQLIRENVISINDINNFGDYICNEILKLGSKSLEDIYIKKWNNYKDININSNINKYVSELLIFIMEIIEQIKIEINDYKILLEILS